MRVLEIAMVTGPQSRVWRGPFDFTCGQSQQASSAKKKKKTRQACSVSPGSGPIRVFFVAEGEQAMAFKLGSLNLNAVAQVHTIPCFYK